MNFELLLKNYKIYLLDNGVSDASANSYISYLKNACKKVIDKDFKEDDKTALDAVSNSDFESRSTIVELLRTRIQDAKKNGDFTKKTLQNYLSSINKFSSYIAFSKNDWTGGSLKRKLGKFKIKSSYTHDDLIDVFLFRLNTQDRYYNDINASLPCRLLRKIFSNTIYKDEYRDMFVRTLDETKFLVSDKNDTILLKDIVVLRIDGKKVDIECTDGAKYTVFTEVYKKKEGIKGKVFEEIRDATLSRLSLDHDEALFNIMKKLIIICGELQKLSNAILEYKSKNNLSPSKLATNFYENEYSALAINEAKLLEDIKSVFSHISLTIMDSKYNSSKNKTVV